jgi:hypothetical protein
MARIDSGPVDATDSFDDVPKSKWADLVDARSMFLAVKINYDCRCLVRFCEDAERVWEELGYDSAEHMIRKGYGLDPVEIELAVAWLKHNEPQVEIGLKEVSKRVKIRELRDEHPDWTQARIAQEVGVTRQFVTKVEATESSQWEEIVAIPTDIEGNSSRADFRKLPSELQQAVVEKRVSLNAAAIQAGVRHKPSAQELCVRHFRRVENRLETLRHILQELDDHERAVVADCFSEWLVQGD